jgi:hypothetical protein
MSLKRYLRDSTADDELTCDDIDVVVAKLRRINRDATLDYAIRVGSLIIHYFYGGDMQAWRAKGPKAASFRRLAARPDLPMSPTVLYRCVATFELCERLNVVSRWKHVTASHVRAVLNLDSKDQEQLLCAASSEHWNVQRIEREARLRRSTVARKGRRPAPVLVRRAQHLERFVRSNPELFELHGYEHLSDDEREKVRKILTAALQAVQEGVTSLAQSHGRDPLLEGFAAARSVHH